MGFVGSSAISNENSRKHPPESVLIVCYQSGGVNFIEKICASRAAVLS